MPSSLPDGQPVPADGRLPAGALTRVGQHGFGIYVHVPFCASRCGYCDFNTYTSAELGDGGSQHSEMPRPATSLDSVTPRPATSLDSYADTVLKEVALAASVLAGSAPPVRTVFFGGGTPTLLPPGDLARILAGIEATFGLAPGAEVTTEANPESVDPRKLGSLRAAGFTRISLGMQSAASHVLALLDRKHSPGRAVAAAMAAREAGFEHVNLDLIYGTPGETADDFAASLAAVVSAGVDHVSAYSLIVEEGTRLAARIGRGEIVAPDDDVAADRYHAAEAFLSAAGLSWYEVSNWAASAEAACRHNLLYWRGGDWWGFGPGAHSHVGGVRWWNVKHPSAYAARLAGGSTPAHGREILADVERRTEDIMLRLRLAEGLPLAVLSAGGLAAARRALADGLLSDNGFARGRAVLTLRGRLLADAVVLSLIDPSPVEPSPVEPSLVEPSLVDQGQSV